MWLYNIQVELQQLEARFPDCVLVEKGREKTVYSFSYKPADPGWVCACVAWVFFVWCTYTCVCCVCLGLRKCVWERKYVCACVCVCVLVGVCMCCMGVVHVCVEESLSACIAWWYSSNLYRYNLYRTSVLTLSHSKPLFPGSTRYNRWVPRSVLTRTFPMKHWTMSIFASRAILQQRDFSMAH